MEQPAANGSLDHASDLRPIRLVLLDDRALFRESLTYLLRVKYGLEIVADCSTASEALEALSRNAVDIVLLNPDASHNGKKNYNDFIPAARAGGFEGKFLVLTCEIDATDAALFLNCGASGIFLECESSPYLIQTIRTVASGKVWVDQKIVQLLATQFQQPRKHGINVLTSREQAVLDGILNGLTSKEIGITLGLSEATIKNTLQHLFAGAGVHNRSQLVRAVIEGRVSNGKVPRFAKP